MAETAFEVIAPTGPRAPVVVHLPHASTAIPDDVRRELLLTDRSLTVELCRLTDWHTDELFAGLREVGATLFVNRLSRLVFDPERFLDETAEPMAARGQGVVYWQGSELQPIRQASAGLRSSRVSELYQPYHAALDALVGQLLREFGACTVIDGHSFATRPLPSEIDQSPDRPDICIGTDDVHTPMALAEALETGFAAEGLRVARDTPFAGTFVPSGFYRVDARVRSVMVEMRRGLYIDEATAQKLPTFDDVAMIVARVVTATLASYSTTGGSGQHSS